MGAEWVCVCGCWKCNRCGCTNKDGHAVCIECGLGKMTD